MIDILFEMIILMDAYNRGNMTIDYYNDAMKVQADRYRKLSDSYDKNMDKLQKQLSQL